MKRHRFDIVLKKMKVFCRCYGMTNLSFFIFIDCLTTYALHLFVQNDKNTLKKREARHATTTDILQKHRLICSTMW